MIEYELTPQEFLDFNLLYSKKRIIKERITFLMLFVAIAMLNLVDFINEEFPTPWMFTLACSFFALLIISLMPAHGSLILKRRIKKGVYKNAYGKKKIILFDDYFRLESEESNANVKYTVLSDCRKIGKFVCLVLRDNTVVPIPERYVQNSEIIEFVNARIVKSPAK
jgi:hypothetical protein